MEKVQVRSELQGWKAPKDETYRAELHEPVHLKEPVNFFLLLLHAVHCLRDLVHEHAGAFNKREGFAVGVHLLEKSCKFG